ncbi:MAG: hypothetical protein GF417_11015 [Candidatus Latescibacteria bacterium]|nr:hypothetical protein [bacterium]MBD3424956.1 hypothetical protein [Candidatus Latescibacterota bacterium]
MKKICLLITVLFVSLPAGSPGRGPEEISDKDEFARLAELAVSHNSSGRKIEAVRALEDAIQSIWPDIPLEVRDIRLISNPASYTVKEDNIYSAGEPIYITSRIYGHTLKKDGDCYHINITTDFLVLGNDGEVLAGQENAYRFDNISPIPKFDFSLDLNYTLSGLTPGIYRIKSTVNDSNSGESFDFVNPIEIR